jgi:transcriptional regulator with XRE-family HTH domain
MSVQLKKIRKERRVTLEELAKHLEVSKSYLSRVENGIHPISMSIAISIADFFEVSLDELLGRKVKKH